MALIRRALALAALLLGVASLAAGGSAGFVAHLRLTGVIDQVNAAFIEEGIAAATESGATAVLVEIDSPGGELTSTDRIIKAILGSPVPVMTWVSPEGGQAASAATFITLAGDVAAMAPRTTIGAASVVGAGGEDLPDTIAAKVTNDLVAQIRELADEHGRSADWAESAVREAASLGASDAAALEPPVVDFLAATTDELFALADRGVRADGYAYHHDGEPLPPLSGLPLQELTMNIGQQFLHLLSDPNIAFLLFTIGFYGIIAELLSPNGVSGIIGVIAIVLAFIGSNSLPLNVGGLLLILIGIGLFVLEFFVTSFGLLTVGGVIAFVLGAFALWTGVDGTDSITIEINPALILVLLAVAIFYVWLLVRGMIEVRQRLSRTDPMLALVGASGVAQTALTPGGIAYAKGETWSARSQSGTIRPGAAVRVVEVHGLELIVEDASGDEADPPPAKSEEE